MAMAVPIMSGQGRWVAHCVLFCVALFLVPMATAQENISTDNRPVSVLIVDMQRLKSDTAAGRDMHTKTVEIRKRIQAGIAEREEKLREEERLLAKERTELDPEDFRNRVRAFEKQVFSNREFSERESRRLQLVLSGASALLRERATRVLTTIMRERGAEVLLDSSQIVLSADRLDITDEAIRRLDVILPEMPVEIVESE